MGPRTTQSTLTPQDVQPGAVSSERPRTRTGNGKREVGKGGLPEGVGRMIALPPYPWTRPTGRSIQSLTVERTRRHDGSVSGHAHGIEGGRARGWSVGDRAGQGAGRKGRRRLDLGSPRGAHETHQRAAREHPLSARDGAAEEPPRDRGHGACPLRGEPGPLRRSEPRDARGGAAGG